MKGTLRVTTTAEECERLTGHPSTEGRVGALSKDEIQRQVDAVRSQRSELENHVIDEYRAGYIGRREFMRRGAVVGMSLPLLSFLATACGSGEKTESGSGGTPATQADVTPGGTIKAGLQAPGSDLNPIVVNNQGEIGRA